MSKNILDILQWVLIVIFGIVIITQLNVNKDLKYSFEAHKKNGEYIAAYQSKTIGDLKKENRELYDSLKNKKDVKQAVIIKYKYVYNGDTVKIDRKLPAKKDSIYTYSKSNDSINYTLTLKTYQQPEWYKLNFTLNDKLMLVNREKNGSNEMTVSTNNGGIIQDVDVFNKKTNVNSFMNRFSISANAGVGYGLISKRPDIYVGVGVSFRFNKIKD